MQSRVERAPDEVGSVDHDAPPRAISGIYLRSLVSQHYGLVGKPLLKPSHDCTVPGAW